MKVLFLSESGDGLSVGQRLVEEGHDVWFWIKDAKQYADSGRGIVERVDSWRPWVKEADLVVADMVGFGQYDYVVKEKGTPALSLNKVSDLLELDRGKAIELFEKANMTLPTTYKFGSPEEAKELAVTFPERGVVIKPSGNIETAGTRIARSAEQYEWALQQYGQAQSFIVQEIVEGVEVSCEGWFNGKDWLEPFNITFEEKKLLPGGYGPNTGCMGNVVMPLTSNTRLAKETVQKLTPWLSKIGYRGPIDINSIVNEDGAHVLEATARMGYDAIEALMEGLKEPVIDLLFETAVGVKKKMDLTQDKMIAVRLSVPPWPSAEPKQKHKGMPIGGLTPERLKHIYMTDVYKEDEEYKYAAGDGVVMKVTARGRDVREARNRVYRTVDGIELLDKQFRTDIGKRVNSDVEQLRSLGYL